MNDIFYTVMRRLRTPLILLLLVFAVAVLGMVVIPGLDNDGVPYRMHFLDAIYFVSFMMTTIGFGEIPHQFTAAQRIWVTSIIFFSVSVWIYAIGSVVALLQHRELLKHMHRQRFRRNLQKIGEGYYLVCGLGDTGSDVVRGLHERDLRVAAVDIESGKIERFRLGDLADEVPVLVADAREPANLQLAGIDLHSDDPKRGCLGVVAITNDDKANLTIAITAKLLNPGLPVLARCEEQVVADNMASFNTDVIIKPFDVFAERLEMALARPSAHLLQELLTALPGEPLPKGVRPPGGRWLLCGMGRFGQAIENRLKDKLELTVLDSVAELVKDHPDGVVGKGTEAKTLEQARVREASGIVAGTNDDIDNLSILMTAAELNPRLFLVARQDEQKHDPLFRNSGAALVARRHEIVARRVITSLATPELDEFLRASSEESEDWNFDIYNRITNLLDGSTPVVWTVKLSKKHAPALRFAIRRGMLVQLGDLKKDPRDRDDKLHMVPLMLKRKDGKILLPPSSTDLQKGDQLLFCGTDTARTWQNLCIEDATVLYYLITGKEMSRVRDDLKREMPQV